jgi:molecular chaperone GrpE (heat shock protein)
LKLHSALKKKELNPKDTEWFVDAIELCVVKLPELQGQYQKSKTKVQRLQNKFQHTQYRKQKSEKDLHQIKTLLMTRNFLLSIYN